MSLKFTSQQVGGVVIMEAIKRFPKVVTLQAGCSSADLELPQLRQLREAIDRIIKELES